MDYANPKEMKRPVNWGQMIGIVSGILIPVLLWLNGLSNKVETVAVKQVNTEQRMFDNQMSTEKKLDKIDNKLDQIMIKQEYQK